MKALGWHKNKVSVDEFDDPRIEEPTDAIVKETDTAICGSDLHLYKMVVVGLKPGAPLGTRELVTHTLPLDEAPEAYKRFQDKRDGTFKVVLHPH